MRRIAVLLVLLLLLGLGCGEEEEEESPGSGLLYVSQATTSQIDRYEGATELNGNIPPSNTLRGGNTSLDSPRFLFLDVDNDRLYVADFGLNSILIFDGASTLGGDVFPSRQLSGSETRLSGPAALAVDTGGDLLYVSNSVSNSITVYRNASTLNGNVPPVRNLTGLNTGLSGNQGILLDTANDRLFVASTGNNRINIWDSASTVDGDTLPTRVLSGSLTELSQPVDLLLDGQGRLVVSNQLSSRITIYSDAATLNGNIPPVRFIGGSNSGLNQPQQMVLDSSRDDLYVANGGDNSVLVFSPYTQASGDVAWDRRLQGALTRLAGPSGVALDTTRGIPQKE